MEGRRALWQGPGVKTNNQTSTSGHGVPEAFVNKFGGQITGILCGFDRVRFRATLRLLFQPSAMEAYLQACGVLIKHFKPFAEKITQRIRQAAWAAAEAAGRPVRYLGCAQQSKEELARQIAREEGIASGLIAVFSAVEPCLSYAVRGERESREIHLVLENRKCTHLYHYYQHPGFGLIHVRVQTWFPFNVEVCLNGREWLARQMDRAGLDYEQRDNCFARVSDPVRAQALLDEQLKTDWPRVLDGLLEQAHPLHAELGRPLGQRYYWSASQTEFATDVMFRDAASLAGWYPQFLHHGIRSFGSADVLRFLGAACPDKFRGEVTSTLRRRPEGVRLKHVVNGNSLKVYDKQGSVLRVETTIVNPHPFRVYRPSETDPQQQPAWRYLRRGVADLWRRAEVSRAANGRYLGALASVTGKTPLAQEARPVCRARTVDRQRYRALNPWAPADGALLEAISRGEFALNGLRNRDLRALLYPPASTAADTKRQAAAVTRQLALLRAHGLLKKVSGTHRWLLTDHGRRIVTALLAAHQADVDQLTKLAA
ncbi:hypothetical protein OPIT5_24060 [Opitutaceae bacterium TAV5]|nr:hypothetical protein OPIT5_24060 [Opitutaceae bacterium TAV5]